MQKTLILGVLFACTTITYSANFDRNDTPPIARLKSDNFDQSMKHSDQGNSPESQIQNTPPYSNFNSSFSLRHDSLRPSTTPTHSTNASPSHSQGNNSTLLINENVKKTASSFLEILKKISTELTKDFNDVLNSVEEKKEQDLQDIKTRLRIAFIMANPDFSPEVSSATQVGFSKIENASMLSSDDQPFNRNGQYSDVGKIYTKQQ